MKFQDSSFNGLKVTLGTKSVTHRRTHPRSQRNMPHQFFQSLGHKNRVYRGIHYFLISGLKHRLWTHVPTIFVLSENKKKYNLKPLKITCI